MGEEFRLSPEEKPARNGPDGPVQHEQDQDGGQVRADDAQRTQPDPGAGESAPSTGAAGPGKEVMIIEAPEAKPVSELPTALTPSEVKPLLPDEKGFVVIAEAAKIEWMEAETPKGAAGAPRQAAAQARAGMEAGVSWGEEEPVRRAVMGPEEEAGERLPLYPPLPPQFRGTMADIRMFIRNGTLLFFAGAVVYLVLALYAFGVAALDAFNWWSAQRATDNLIGGLLSLLLSSGSFSCVLLSRQKLEEPLRRNDLGALHRRLVAGAAAGLVFGLVLGGLLFFLAYVKVEELPFVHPAPELALEETSGNRA